MAGPIRRALLAMEELRAMGVERLAAGHVEGVDEALEGHEQNDFGEGNDVRESERGEGEGLDGAEGLGPDEKFAAVETLDPDSGEGAEEEGDDLSGEGDEAEDERGVSEAVDQPGRGETGHPGADDGDGLTEEEEFEVAVAEGAPGVGEVGERIGEGRHSLVRKVQGSIGFGFWG